MKILASTLLLGVFSTATQASTADDWSKITQPNKATTTQSIGKYDGGCVSGAVPLPLEGTGYQVMRLSRSRYFGHPDLIRFIENLGRAANDQKIGTLLVGDLGQPRGGPSLSGHRSHQTGLDVDIWFMLSPIASTHKLDANERETWGAPSMLASNSDTIDNQQWTGQHEKMLEAAARMPEVERIFVNPSIKRLLCTNKANHGWLRKIRPWWKHDDHFHVRLKCPDGNPHCTSQAALPEGNGCDASLAYWFSEEAKHPKKPQAKPGRPRLPDRCDAVLND
jgi:penicillin-insensitive murein endopeptidase